MTGSGYGESAGSYLPYSCSGSGEAPVGIGFAFAAAMDRDKRLFLSIFVCDAVEISGDEPGDEPR